MSKNPLPQINFEGFDPWGNKRREARIRLYSAWSQALAHGIIVRSWPEIVKEFEVLPENAMEEVPRIFKMIRNIRKGDLS